MLRGNSGTSELDHPNPGNILKRVLPRSLYGLIVLFLLLSSLILFLFLAWMIFSMSNNYLEMVTSRCGQRVAALINYSLTSNMISNHHSEIPVEIEKICETPGIDAIRVYDADGELRHESADGSHSPSYQPDHLSILQERFSTIDTLNSTCVHSIRDKDQRRLIVHAPILSMESCLSSGCHEEGGPGTILGVTEIVLPLTELDNTLNQILYEYFGLVILFLLAIFSSLLFFVQRFINRPLKQIVQASRSVTAGDLTIRVRVSPSDISDIRHVANALNSMLESINHSNQQLVEWSNELENKVRVKSEDMAKTQHEIYQIEHLASLGRLSSSVAHEINNPLAGVLTYTKLIIRSLEKLDAEPQKKQNLLGHLEMIRSEIVRCGDIVKGLLNFSRDKQSSFESISLNEILVESRQLIQHQFQISDTKLVTDFSALRDRVDANRNQLIQACLAVLTNALEAVEGSADPIVAYRSFNPDQHYVIIEIWDNGVGIPEEDLNHIFEPFFSSKKEMSGIGLGLAVTYGIIEQHGGRIQVRSTPGEGTSFKFILKLLQEGDNHGE